MSEREYKTFKQFWPLYLSQHQHPVSRLLHYLGTIISSLTLIYLLLNQLLIWLPLVLLIGYGPAWFGHFVLEKNRPATFQYPFWSLLADYKMLWLAATGKLSKEL